MIDVTLERDAYVAEFGRVERALAGKEPGWLGAIRKAAIAHFAEMGFPTMDEEDWRFTSVAPIAKTKFDLESEVRGAISRADAAHLGFGTMAAAEIVFVDGRHAPELSSGDAGLAVSIASALAGEPHTLEPHLARYAGYAKHPFAALNTAFLRDGAFVRIADGAALANPIHVLYITTRHESPIATFPRTLVIAGRNSQATVIESHIGFGGGAYFSCPVTEIVARDGANVHLVKIEDESARAYHVAVTHSYQERASSTTLHNVQLGGALSRNDVHAVLGDEGAEARLDGLYLASDERLVDNHTTIEHAKPHCASRELYKGVLDGAARAVFNGRIIVRKDAQKTDSKQTNRNLLLSEDATVFTNPQLEIFADDVRCTHGATIGHLDDEALFYMRSRGLSKEMAGSLLIYAFASEIIDRIPFETARIRLERALFARLASGHMNGDPTA